MTVELFRQVCLGLWAAGALFFLDAPFRTLGQRYLAQRPRERLILLSLEMDLLALWAAFMFYMKWDRALAPVAAEPALAAAGALVVLAGVAIAVWAKLRLGRWFTINFGVKAGHELVTDGPYGLSRHPIYTGILVALLGSALAWNSALTLGLAVLSIVPLFFHTVYEEVLFEKHFGDPYRDYQRRVPRLVPFAPAGART